MLDIQRRRTPSFYFLLTLPATAMGFALSVQISVLSWILATQYGLDIHEIGLVWAAGPMAGIIGQVAIGLMSDRLWIWNGRRRFFIVIGGVLAALMILALPAMGLISSALGLESVMGVAIAVALALDLAVNVGFNPTRSIIADVTEGGAERSRGYSWMQTVSGSFSLLAYAIGALLGNMALIYFAVALVLLFAVVPALLIEEPRPDEATGGPAAPGDKVSFAGVTLMLSPLWAIAIYDVYAMAVRWAGTTPAGYGAEIACAAGTALLIGHALLSRSDGSTVPEFRKVLAAHSLSWIGIQSLFIYLVSFLQYRMPSLDAEGLGRTAALAFLALNAVAALAPALLLAPLARRFRRTHVHAGALALMAAAFLAAWMFVRAEPLLYALMAVAGIGWGAMVSLPFAIMSERVDGRRMGLFMGLFNLSVVLPQLVASFGVGAFMSRAEDKGALFLVGAVAIGLSAIAWLFLRPRQVEREGRSARIESEAAPDGDIPPPALKDKSAIVYPPGSNSVAG